MDDDEQGASRKAALKYAGPRSDGKEESFIEAKAELEDAMGLMAMALIRDDVSHPRPSNRHSGLSVKDAIAFVNGVTLTDQEGHEIVTNQDELAAARNFLKTKTVNGNVTRATGSMHDILRKCVQVMDSARAAAELRIEGKALDAKTRRRDARRAKANTLGPSGSSSSGGDDDGDGGAGKAVRGGVEDTFYGVRFGHNGHQVLTHWAGPGGCEEAVSGAKAKHTGGKCTFQRFNGVNALSMANTYAHGSTERKSARGGSEGKGDQATRDLELEELRSSRDHALERATAAEDAITDAESRLEEENGELDRLATRAVGKSSVADALDAVTCGDEVAVAEAQAEVAAVEAASTRLREVATLLRHKLADLEKTGSRIVQVTNRINAEHLASSAISAPADKQEQEVAPQRADPKTGLAGGGRKHSKKEKSAKRRKKRVSAAAGHLCAHRWCRRLCVNWAAGHILCRPCDLFRNAETEDLGAGEWQDEPSDTGYYQNWLGSQVYCYEDVYGGSAGAEWRLESDGTWARTEITRYPGQPNESWPVINGTNPDGRAVLIGGGAVRFGMSVDLEGHPREAINPATRAQYEAHCLSHRERDFDIDRTQRRPCHGCSCYRGDTSDTGEAGPSDDDEYGNGDGKGGEPPAEANRQMCIVAPPTQAESKSGVKTSGVPAGDAASVVTIKTRESLVPGLEGIAARAQRRDDERTALDALHEQNRRAALAQANGDELLARQIFARGEAAGLKALPWSPAASEGGFNVADDMSEVTVRSPSSSTPGDSGITCRSGSTACTEDDARLDHWHAQQRARGQTTTASAEGDMSAHGRSLVHSFEANASGPVAATAAGLSTSTTAGGGSSIDDKGETETSVSGGSQTADPDAVARLLQTSSSSERDVWAVARGRTRGLFLDLEEAQKQVDGFPNAFYKKFASTTEATAWLQSEGDGDDDDMPILHTPPSSVVSAPQNAVFFQEAGHAAVYSNLAAQIRLAPRVSEAQRNVETNAMEAIAAADSLRVATDRSVNNSKAASAQQRNALDAAREQFEKEVAIAALTQELEKLQVARSEGLTLADECSKKLGSMLTAAPQTLAGDTTGWMPAVGGGSGSGSRGSKPQKKNSRHKKKSASKRQRKERQRRKERKLKSKMKKVKAELSRAKAKHRRRRGDPSDPSSSSSSSSYTSPSDSSTDSEDDTDSDHHDESSDQTGSGSDVSVKDSDILPKKKKKRARGSRSLKENSARSKALKLALSFLKQPFSKTLFDQQQEVVLAIAIATLNKRVYAELYHYLNGHFQDLLIGIPKDDGIGLYHALLGRCQQRSIHEETEARQCYAQTRMDVSSNSRFQVVGAWENFVMIEARLFAINKWYQSVRTIIAGEEGEVSLHTPRSLMVHVRNYLPSRYDPFLLYLELQDENMRSNKGREMTWPEVR